jgi:hypothetical protein
MSVPSSPIYKLNTNSPLNQPYYVYQRGGQGAHSGLGEDDRYVVLLHLEDEEAFIFLNITTGQVVPGGQPLDRFVLATAPRPITTSPT